MKPCDYVVFSTLVIFKMIVQKIWFIKIYYTLLIPKTDKRELCAFPVLWKNNSHSRTFSLSRKQ